MSEIGKSAFLRMRKKGVFPPLPPIQVATIDEFQKGLDHMTNQMPEAWGDLIEGLTLLARHYTQEHSPLHCEHDTLWVMADASKFTGEEIERLSKLGFDVDNDGGFQSIRFGSA